MDELKLTESATIDEFEWSKTAEAERCGIDPELTFGVESKYNLHHLNNEDAIGYRNLEERAADIANNKNLAHETVFDKMLADYFLEKRGDYKRGNKLMKDLEELLGSDSARSGKAAADLGHDPERGPPSTPGCQVLDG